MACATFPLIWVGGLVTTYQAGMAVPDWPNTYGYNLFLYPLSTWFAGPFDLFIEHGHRLLGAIVGFIAVALVVSVFITQQSTHLKILAVVALLGVCLQGALGGMRVLLDERTLAMIHACAGPAFFAFAAALAMITSIHWKAPSRPATDAHAARIQRLAIFTTLLVFLQLLLGAQLRHTPVDAGTTFFRTALFFHLFVAAALVLHAVLLLRAVVKSQTASPVLLFHASTLVGLMLLQLALGGGSWVVKYGFPQWLGEHVWTSGYTVTRENFFNSLVVTSHVGIGSAILAVSLSITLRALHFLKAVRAAVAPCSFILAEVAT
jgi:cytochrome c oxidase assembly protein subunit 15